MKKLLSLILAVALVMSFAVPSVAAEEVGTTVTLTPSKTELSVGDTFTVTAALAGNTGFCAMTIGLQWNAEVVKFEGFATTYNEDDEIYELTDTILGQSVVINPEKGIVTNARTNNSTKNGTIFIANFTVVGNGKADIGLIQDEENVSCFQMKVVGGTALEVAVDKTAVSELMIAEKVTKYTITISDTITNGTVTTKADETEVTEAAEGDIISLIQEPNAGYEFVEFTVTDAEGNAVPVTNNTFSMPASNVTVFATFAEGHTCSYNQAAVDAKYLKSEATCQSGAVYYKSCTCGEYSETAETFVSGDPVQCVYENGACKWCGAAEPAQTPGYYFAASADVSTENGGNATIHVKITGHSDSSVTTYNAYDLTLTFDDTKLEFVSGEGAAQGDQTEIKQTGNNIQIVGVGDAKTFDVEVATLTFKTKAEGPAEVTVSKVQVSDQKEAVGADIPEATPKHYENDTTADTTPGQSLILVPYKVTKPAFVSGEDGILHGEEYTFSYTDTTNYTYSGLKVTVGGTEVTPTEVEGVYTVANVTGTVVIEATQTPNSYDVSKPANVSGPNQATYGSDYVFTVTPTEGQEIEKVTVTTADGTEIRYTINEKGEYVIAGTDISGAFTITVTQKEVEIPETKYTNITFSGITAEEIEGGLTQQGEAGKDFTFKLIKAEGVTYTVKIGEEVLTANEDGSYTIPAAKMIEGNLTVTIKKAENINVEVTEYIKLDGKSMFLVTAKSVATDSVLKYGEETMYRSSKYDAYSWLVISADNGDAVKAAAEAAIAIAESGVTAAEVAYDNDVNGTNKVDVNDAQLVYDMYMGEYEISESVTIAKFLEADVSTDKKLDVNDVVAVISAIINAK